MPRYSRLSLLEREELSRLLAMGASLHTIGTVLGRAPSSLSRELARHHVSRWTYRAVAAQHCAQRWAASPRKPRKLAIEPRLEF